MAYRETTINYCPPLQDRDPCDGHYHYHPVQWSPSWYTPYGSGAKTTKYGYPAGYWGGCSTPTGYVVAPMKPSTGIAPSAVAMLDQEYSGAYYAHAPYHLRPADSAGRSYGRPWQQAAPGLQTVERYMRNPAECYNINEEPGYYLQWEGATFG